jgi:uncharacterized Fe-S cluster-containing radical SAM superfamily protein
VASIATDEYSIDLRDKAIRVGSRELLMSRIAGSDQQFDLTNPPNAGGIGRLRHFHPDQGEGWPQNPLPIAPAARALGLSRESVTVGEVFQNAACNWRCWYCYVPFSLLSANPDRSEWVTSEELVSRYRALDERPLIIDCSGGQPDLVPEWIPWMIDALVESGLDRETYLWSDDNLSNDYFWQYLSTGQIDKMAQHPNYGRVCCFKGFDDESFAFNTKAAPDLFARQFELFERLLATGMDLYAYATLTGPNESLAEAGILQFMDRLQEIDANLPLRLVPLRIEIFGTVVPRVHDAQRHSLEAQEVAIAAWTEELARRFPPVLRETPIAYVRWAGA